MYENKNAERIDKFCGNNTVGQNAHPLNSAEQEIRKKNCQKNPDIRKKKEQAVFLEFFNKGNAEKENQSPGNRKKDFRPYNAERDFLNFLNVFPVQGNFAGRRQNKAEF